jgi:2-oxoglutarate ferredoxin oxidoreductase subunit alpha
MSIGFNHAKANLKPLGLQLKRADAVGDRIFVDGNTAAALGAVYGGATVCAWYPITPSTSLAEASPTTAKLRHDPRRARGALRHRPGRGRDRLDRHRRRRRLERLAGLHLHLGPGHLADAGVHRPQLLRRNPRGDLRRAARRPSTGMPTRTQQSDILSAAYASHGDTKHVLLLPEGPGECFEMGAQAFDLADRLQTMVFVMLDLDIGMNEWLIEPFKWDDSQASSTTAR